MTGEAPEPLPAVERIEYKYFVPFQRRATLLNDLFGFFLPDAHASAPKGSYTVSSIYFDDPFLSSYHGKMAGDTCRTKFRCRFYPNGEGERVNLEFKTKQTDRYIKTKAALPVGMLSALLRGELLMEDLADTPDLLPFLSWIRARRLKPFLRVDYQRYAFFSPTHSGLRITLDHSVRTARVGSGRLPVACIPVLPEHLAVLEVKGPPSFPIVLQHLVRNHQLKRRAISKYALAVQNLALNTAMTPG